jgi:predicted nuclease of predicted toxin-antitoxin system
MGVSRKTVHWLRANGHDAVHLSELGMKRARDDEVLAHALREERVVLTFDLDFGQILAASREMAPSVIIFRLSSARPDHVNVQLEDALRDTSAALGAGAIVIVEDERRRVRKLPVGS